MNRTWTLILLMTWPLVAFAQTRPNTSAPYQPAVPAASNVNTYGGGWSGYYAGGYGGGTVAGSAMNGMANVISSKGDYNLSTSAAAVNMTQAQKNEIQNRQLYTDTYFQMRQTNKQAREAERTPRLTMEQLSRIARQGVPQALSPSQLNPVTGQLEWPSALQLPSFELQRNELEALFAQRAKYGGLSYTEQMKATGVLDTMLAGLKDQIRQIPPEDYMVCRNFLQSLSYTATRNELQLQ